MVLFVVVIDPKTSDESPAEVMIDAAFRTFPNTNEPFAADSIVPPESTFPKAIDALTPA